MVNTGTIRQAIACKRTSEKEETGYLKNCIDDADTWQKAK